MGQSYLMMVWQLVDATTYGIFYVAMVQYVLIFSSDMQVVMPIILKVIDSLHNKASGRISIRVPWRHRNIILVYPLIGQALVGTLLYPTRYYSIRQQYDVVQHISTHTIIEITVAEASIPGSLAILCWQKKYWIQSGHLQGPDEKLELDMPDQIDLTVIK